MKNVFVSCEKGIRVDKKTVQNIVNMVTKELELDINSLEYNFISSKTMIEINNSYLGHNYATDIITFDYSVEKNILDGEIFISLEDAVENSKIYRVSADNELLRLIIHGILHLIGLDDTTIAKKKKMKKVEDEMVLKFLKFSKGLLIKK
ncbi:MAG: rRNA maturation RNase YbeY [Ignavibacteriales bacterium]|nr:rRNA maturation RNase YbeY [Ignavibacteriales bacterium]